MASKNPWKRVEAELRKHALRYPQTREDHPWGESAFKVKDKVFIFMSNFKNILRVTVKLPLSGRTALLLPFAAQTGYGLGKSGWVTATFREGDEVPVEMLVEWMDESFRTVAPKRVLAALERRE